MAVETDREKECSGRGVGGSSSSSSSSIFGDTINCLHESQNHQTWKTATPYRWAWDGTKIRISRVAREQDEIVLLAGFDQNNLKQTNSCNVSVVMSNAFERLNLISHAHCYWSLIQCRSNTTRGVDHIVSSLCWDEVKWQSALVRRRGAHLPFRSREPVGGNTTNVRDAWPTVTFPACAGTKVGPNIAWWHVCEQLAQVCTRQRGGRVLNPRPSDRMSSAQVRTPPKHTSWDQEHHNFHENSFRTCDVTGR